MFGSLGAAMRLAAAASSGRSGEPTEASAEICAGQRDDDRDRGGRRSVSCQQICGAESRRRSPRAQSQGRRGPSEPKMAEARKIRPTKTPVSSQLGRLSM